MGRISSFIQKHYGGSPSANLKVTSISAVGDSCYTKILIESWNHSREITLFLTPDEKYLTTNLMEIDGAGSVASSQVDGSTTESLLAGSPPSKGRHDAPITLVEFLDFQCPDCRHFAELLAGLPADDLKRVRVILHHRPLLMHSWARKAAMMSICVDNVDRSAFWRMPDFFFAQQGQLTSQNLESEFFKFTTEELNLDSAPLEACLHSGAYDNALRRDDELSRQFNIRQTPTVFINGRRYTNFRTTEDLKAALDDALKERQSSASSPNPMD